MNERYSSAMVVRDRPDEVPADLSAAAKMPQDDFALRELDKEFVTLLSKIFIAEPKQGGSTVAASRQNRTKLSQEVATARDEYVLARLEPVEQAIMATPAQTIAGLGIKARHAAYVVSEYWDAPVEQIDWNVRVVRLLIEDVCKAAGVLLPFDHEGNH